MWRTQSTAQRDIMPDRSRSIGKQSAGWRFFFRFARLAGGKAETKETDVMGYVARCPGRSEYDPSLVSSASQDGRLRTLAQVSYGNQALPEGTAARILLPVTVARLRLGDVWMIVAA
jgi:hypothetical protein